MADDIRAIFRITGGDASVDRQIVTRAGISVGRVSTGNDLVLPDTQVSRHHLRIFYEDGRFYVEDTNSSNGVRVDNKRIRAGEKHEIYEGNAIGVGPYTLIYEKLITPDMPGESYMGNGRANAPAAPAATEMLSNTPTPTGAGGMSRGRTTSAAHTYYRRNGWAEQNAGLPIGVPQDVSSWLRYLPAIYTDPPKPGGWTNHTAFDPNFMGRFLLIFESVFSPIQWMVDNFDLYLSPETAPSVWLEWMGSWFDLLILPELPIERQRRIASQLGWLFLRRGTKPALERLLELYFEVKPEIIDDERACHFRVRLPIAAFNTPGQPAMMQMPLAHNLAWYLIESQKPAFATFDLEIV